MKNGTFSGLNFFFSPLAGVTFSDVLVFPCLSLLSSKFTPTQSLHSSSAEPLAPTSSVYKDMLLDDPLFQSFLTRYLENRADAEEV